MLALLKKEIKSFLSSLMGYLIIILFLLFVGLFTWVFPNTGFNILESGYASIDSLFVIAPWVFMFLIPAVSMKMFSEEKRTGTIEFLFTKPLGDWQIILAKYLASFLLAVFAIVPTLIYFYSVSNLGNPQGNIDAPGTWGSYLGLVFLISGFASIGIFASAITTNQIVSFILAAFLCYITYIGFDAISGLDGLHEVQYYIQNLGINEHYRSMSRGVIDTRDIIYFFSLSYIFLFLTKVVLESRKW